MRFFAAHFSGAFGYVFQKFAPKIFFRTLLGKIFTGGGGAYPVYFVCYVRGTAVFFFAARFSGDFGYVFQSSPRRYFPDIVGETFRVRTCTGSVVSDAVVDVYMEYCLDIILPISVGFLLGKIVLSSLCPMVCPVVRLFARVGSTRGAFYGSISGRHVTSSWRTKISLPVLRELLKEQFEIEEAKLRPREVFFTDFCGLWSLP